MEEKKLIKKKEKALADGNQEHLAQACNNLGDFYTQHGRHKDALEEYTREANIYQKIGRSKRLEMAMAHRMMGEMFTALCDFDNALKHSNIYLKNVQEVQNKVEEQRAYATLGRTHLLYGESASDVATGMKSFKSAEKAFIRSLLISKDLSGQISRIEKLEMQARLYINLSAVKEQMGSPEESMSYMEKAIKLCKTNDLYELLHLSYISTSLYYHAKDNSTLALRFCNLALDVAERLPNKAKKICETLLLKSEVMIKLGDFQSAKQVLHKAYKFRTPDLNEQASIEKNLKVAAALCNTLDSLVTTDSTDYVTKKKLYEKMADGCCILQNYSKAIDYYLKTLECVELSSERPPPSELIPIYVSLYQTYKDDKQYEKALTYLWKEFELNRENLAEGFSTLCNIGEVCELQMQPFWTIQDVYQKALAMAQCAGSRKLEKIALVRLLKLQKKFSMNTLADELKIEADMKGIDLETIEDDEELESLPNSEEHNTPDIGEEICLEDLSDSEGEAPTTEQEQPRSSRKRNPSLSVKKNMKGETQLHLACIAGNISLVRRLLDQGHVVNVRDNAGWLPLHEACNYGYRDVVELLLDHGGLSAINDKGGTNCDGITPLHDACSNGYLDVAELLLERGANVTLKTDKGETALDVLQRWRQSADLDEAEEVQYENVRFKLHEQLSKAGVCDETTPSPSNKLNRSMDISWDKLKRLAYDSDDENSSSSPRGTSCNDLTLRNSKNVLRDFNSPLKHTNARNEYKSVMDNMKHPNRQSVPSSTCDMVSKRRTGGFLDSEDVDDDWLDDDIGPQKKKRKFAMDRRFSNDKDRSLGKKTANSTLSSTSSKERERSCERSASFEKKSSNNSLSSTPKEHCNDSVFSWLDEPMDAFHSLMDPDTRQRQTSKLKLSRHSSNSNSGNRKAKQQTSLLDSGFCRFRSESPLSIDDNSEVKSFEPDSTTISPIRTDITIATIPVLAVPTTVSFKIKVEEELLLVPVDKKKLSEANIRWLAEEASRRYYNLVGLMPVLRLMTADGFAFEENDIISVALEHTMISSKVLEWKISPLTQRYEEMCAQFNKEAESDTLSALEKAQVSNCLQLNDFLLTPDRTEPVFRAILHQSNLRVLDLSNNFIQSDGCKQLAKSLQTLKQLKVLNLQGNFIATDGLECLAVCQLNELDEIILSQNPLTDRSVRALHKLCSGSKNLRKLYISQCGFTNFYDYDLGFYELTEFDVSFNSLTAACFRKIVSQLNSCRLSHLNLSFTNTDPTAGARFCQLFEGGTCEKFKRLELAGCGLTDSDIYKFVQHLYKSSELQFLDVSSNPKLTFSSFQYLLDKVPQLRKVSFNQCPHVPDIGRIDNCQYQKLPDLLRLTLRDEDDCVSTADKECMLKMFWESHWGGSGKVEVSHPNVTLYVDDNDLNCF